METKYSVYVDRQGGGYFCWYYNCEGDKTWTQVSSKAEASRWARKHLDGMLYKIVLVQA